MKESKLPTTPEAIAQRCWEEAMAWLFREAYIVRPSSGHFRELYTGIVNETLSRAEVREKARDIMFNGHEPTNEAFGMLQVIARGRA